eukprot:scaffold1783_cov106-Isochrysis_galbana.AAC.2
MPGMSSHCSTALVFACLHSQLCGFMGSCEQRRLPRQHVTMFQAGAPYSSRARAARLAGGRRRLRWQARAERSRPGGVPPDKAHSDRAVKKSVVCSLKIDSLPFVSHLSTASASDGGSCSRGHFRRWAGRHRPAHRVHRGEAILRRRSCEICSFWDQGTKIDQEHPRYHKDCHIVKGPRRKGGCRRCASQSSQ